MDIEDYPDYLDRCELYELNDKKTKFLASLQGIARDLESTINICKYLLTLLHQEKPDITMIDALTTAAVVKYARCFKTGCRDKIPQDYLKSLPDNLKANHDYFIDLRDKFIAHSVNIFEDNFVELEIWEESGNKKLMGMGMGGRLRGGLGYQHLKDLISLCTKLSEIVSVNIFRERDRLLAYFKTVPIDELLKSSIENQSFPSDDDVKKIKRWVK